jgi:hypothetical protein
MGSVDKTPQMGYLSHREASTEETTLLGRIRRGRGIAFAPV